MINRADRKRQRIRDQAALDRAKNVESELIDAGRVWVRKGSTSKLVLPGKLDSLLEDGWRKVE